MRWIAALRTAQKIAVGAHSICARKVYRAGNAPGGYGIRPYAFAAHNILLLLYTPRQVDSLREMW